MGAIVPQVITEDKAGGAQIIDGSLRFDSGKSHNLRRTPSSAGNRTSFTWSTWIKKNSTSQTQYVWGASDDGFNNNYALIYHGSDLFDYQEVSGGGVVGRLTSLNVFRDYSSWYHLCIVYDTSNATTSERIRMYVNGTRLTSFTTATYPSQNTLSLINSTTTHYFSHPSNSSLSLGAQLSNVYLIDGQALDPSYFGFTDPLTNTWRPKKYVRTTTITGDTGGAVGFGTNGFYLPFDGNSPIGQDMSGKGNNWTPVNFGGSNTLEKATGALPILNTDGGGKVARVGVRTDSYYANLKLAVPFVGVATDVVQQINGNSASMTSFTANNATFAVHPTAGAPYGTGLYLNSVSDYPNINYAAGTFNFLHNQTGSGTVEFWMYNGAYTTEASMFQGISGSPDIGFAIQMASSTTLQAVISRGVTGSSRATGTANIPQNTWSHIAVTKTINGSNAELKLYVNGVLSASNTSITASDLSNSNSTYSYFRIGQNIGDETSRGWTNYYMNDLRIYDTVKYTQNFIPASTDPDILPDTPSGVAYSSNVALVPSTDGAVAFDGSGDYLSLADNADFTFGTGDLTVEAFVYPTSSSDGFIFDNRNTSGSPLPGIGFGVGSNTPRLLLTGAGPILTASQSLSNNIWHHVAVVKSSGTFYIYINGVQSGSTSDSTNLTSSSAYVGGAYGGGSNYFPGFISNLRIIKGTALYTSNFTPPTAPITSVANTKLLCCKSNSSATAADVTPGTITANGNAVATNFNPFTVNINTQRGQESGYCTWNPLSASSTTLSNGNLDFSMVGGTNTGVRATTAIPLSGKWYYEVDIVSVGEIWLGLQPQTVNSGSNSVYYRYDTGGWQNIYINGSQTAAVPGYTNGDIIGCGYDADNQQIRWYKNGVQVGTNYSLTNTGNLIPWIGHGSGSGSASGKANFGQKPFKFPPPAGFQPLALANTPRPTIVRPDQYVGIVTYTGNGGTQTISGLRFKPDFVWAKHRNGNNEHAWVDTVRGTQQTLNSDRTIAEYTTGSVTAFNSDGFSVGTSVNTNINGGTYVAWAWKAGGNSNTFNINDIGYSTASAAGLTAGTITPTGASVNTKSGFSIIGYNGSGSAGSIPHGLGKTPGLILIKRRTTTNESWRTWHTQLGTSPTTELLLNDTTGARANQGGSINGVNSSTISFDGGGTAVNGGSDTYISYIWAEIPGFSRISSYSGNGSADGPFVWCGFRPRFILQKRTDSTGSWLLLDSSRDPYNAAKNELFANSNIAEYTNTDEIDFLSNGFKVRGTFANLNASGGTYIFAAFAETPSFNLYGGQSNAR